MPVRASSSQAALIVKERDGNRPNPVVLPVRMRSSTRAWQRCRTSRNWIEPPPCGVGGEDLVAHPVDRVEQRQLRAGVRAFPAADQPGGRKRGQHAGVEVVGEFDQFRAVAQAAVAVERRHPIMHLQSSCSGACQIARPSSPACG